MYQIAVVGGNQASKADIDLATAIGGLLIQQYHLLCGGRGGVMEAACKGAQNTPHKQGTVVGILPGPDKTEGNAYLDLVLPTGLGTYRNGVIAQACDAMLAIGGKAGTLSELSLAWHANKPVAIIGPTGWADLASLNTPFQALQTPEEAMLWLARVLP